MSDSELRKALEESFAKADEEQVNETPPDNTPEESQESDLGPAEQGESHQKEEPEQIEAKPEKKKKEVKDDDVPRETKPKKKPSAPVGWSPDARKEFDKLPEHVQQAVYNREVEINRGMQEAADARKFSEGVIRTLEPYQQLFQAEGVQDPLAAVNGLLQTTAMLKFGSKQQKAQRLAQIVQHYDIDIETLDKALAGSLPKDDEETKLQRLLDERLQPVQQFMGQLNQYQQQQHMQLQSKAAQSVQEMRENTEKYPHIEEVRLEMANLLDEAAQYGISPTLDQVYEEACRRTPGVREEIYRKEFGGMMQQNLERKRNAASSISGRQSQGESGKPDFSEMSLRETIAAQLAGGDNRI